MDSEEIIKPPQALHGRKKRKIGRKGGSVPANCKKERQSREWGREEYYQKKGGKEGGPQAGQGR